MLAKFPTTRRDLLRAGASLAGAGTLTRLLADDLPIPVPTQVVKTTNGSVQGLVHDGIQVFKGIRYGAEPSGALRFLPPQKPKPWTGAADATEFGPPAIQLAGGAIASPRSDFGRQLATIFPVPAETKIANEDCLFLNVWTPAVKNDRKRPVMVWLHGGGFAYGSGAWPIYDGTNLARQGDTVIVTVNHRLNVFGYLYLGALSDAYAESGNAGMLDLVLALEWVRDNIEAFGGDPGNVTIMGESGGGAKVSYLLAMPAAKGLFHKAIIQSGPALRGVPKDNAAEYAKLVLEELQVGEPKALACLPPHALVAAAAAAAEKAGRSPATMRLAPVVDGKALPSDPFTPAAPAVSANVPLIIGTNKDEMTLFVVAEPWFGHLTEAQLNGRARQMAGPKSDALVAAIRKLHPDYTPNYIAAAVLTDTTMLAGSITLAERKAAQNAAPVYMYCLVWETPILNGLFKSPHTLEIPLMFDNVGRARVLLGPGHDPEAIAAQMSAAWLAFARTGDPQTHGIPAWPAYTPGRRATMLFDVESRVVDDPQKEIRLALES
ncbi:MAG TPA: carboxylesterase/lipase family protein [Bryobacteraceae bacterium]|nr:carboxylesterase/lipase family protein [Bryobacteraceae bacterium]